MRKWTTLNKYFNIIILILFTLLNNRCGIYSFTGASIPPGAKTISIKNFINNADLVQPTLSQTLTDALKEKFSRQTSLILIPSNGDLDFEGTITNYKTEPVAIAKEQQGSYTRLTITINIKFTNKIKNQDNFETNFSRYKEYSSGQNLNDVEDALITEISALLVDDIFNKSVVNW